MQLHCIYLKSIILLSLTSTPFAVSAKKCFTCCQWSGCNSQSHHHKNFPYAHQLVTTELAMDKNVPKCIVYIAKYSSYQSILTTIVYKNSHLPSRDYYQYYVIMFKVGEMFGCSFNLILSTLCPCLVYKVTLAKIWWLTVLQVSHMMVYITESWYRYLPGLWSLMGLCFTGGLCAGIFFHDSFQFYLTLPPGHPKTCLLLLCSTFPSCPIPRSCHPG